jgi:hypothetical protein
MSTFVGFVLLDEVRFDAEKYVKDLKEDWNLDYDFEITQEDNTIIADYNGMIMTASLMPAPIPDNEAVEQAKTNYRWEKAVEAAEKHKAHLLVSVINSGDVDNIEGAKHYVKLLANATKQEGCLGINILGTVIHPQMYYDFAKLYEENDDFPIENIVYIGLYGDENNTVSGYTYGLEQFGKKELEIIKSLEEAEEVYNFLASISDYIITSDVVLNDGETIGFSEEQKIQISVSEGIAVDGETIKLGF